MLPAEVFAKRNLRGSPSRIHKVKFITYDRIACLRNADDTEERINPERRPGSFGPDRVATYADLNRRDYLNSVR